MRLAGWTFATTFALAACGSFLAAGEDGIAPDAGTPAAATSDAAPDASPPAADAGSRACDQLGVDAVYCEDFDRASIGTNIVGWTGYTETGNTYSVAASGRSPPHALAFEGSTNLWSEAWTVPMTVGAAKIEIRVAVNVPTLSPPVVWMQIMWTQSWSFRQGLALDLAPSTVSVVERAGPPRGETQIGAMSADHDWTVGWHDLVVSIDWASQKAQVQLDGVVLGSLVLGGTYVAGELSIELGAHEFAAALEPKRVLYDNLVVWAQ
jgi:hypothetical protein